MPGMRTGYSAKEVVIVGSSKERLEKQQEGNCSFLAAMERGRDHEPVGSTTGQRKKYLGGWQELPVAGSKGLCL